MSGGSSPTGILGPRALNPSSYPESNLSLTPKRRRRNVKLVPAPKARDVTAWGNAPGQSRQMLEALKARNGLRGLHHVAPTALRSVSSDFSGALPQAITFRAFGAESRALQRATTHRLPNAFNRPYSQETLSARIALIQVFRTFAAQSRDGLRFLHI